MSGYKLAQKRLALKNQHHGHFSQLKLPNVDRGLTDRDTGKVLLKNKSGKLPHLQVIHTLTKSIDEYHAVS